MISLRMEFSSRPLFFMTSVFLTLRLVATAAFRTCIFVGAGGLGGDLGLGLLRLFRTFSIFLHKEVFVSLASSLILRIAAIRRSSSFFISPQILRPTRKVFPVPLSGTFLFLFTFLNVTFFFPVVFLILAQISSLVAALEPSLVVVLKFTTPKRRARSMSSGFFMRVHIFELIIRALD